MRNIMKRESAQPANFGSVVDQIFQNNLSRFFDDDFWGSNRTGRPEQVPVNIRETNQTYEMELMAPGLNKQDFQLNVTGDTFIVSFQHKEETEDQDKEKRWLRKEFKQQSFTRSFSLDDTVDAGKISARYENGVLFISLPKKENAQKISKTIAVS